MFRHDDGRESLVPARTRRLVPILRRGSRLSARCEVTSAATGGGSSMASCGYLAQQRVVHGEIARRLSGVGTATSTINQLLTAAR
jgi:hypothetical protein